jgi:serine/threonine protein kinase/outer membrane protein assembly factor BamB
MVAVSSSSTFPSKSNNYLPGRAPLFDRYEVRAELGRGGMGIVYLAFESALERFVALKILPPELAHRPDSVARLRREAISTARLRHPNIALLYEFGQVDNTPFLAMEYVPGCSLSQLLESGALTPERALHLLSQIGDALDYAHAQGIVHRDIKPSNILVTPDDHAFLIDFGLVDVAESTIQTADGVVLGTPHYIAPEQAEGRDASPASDQYGLAAVAYELLTGVPPFQGRNATSVIYAHIHELPPPPSERQPSLPSSVDRVLLRGLAKQQQHRYPSVSAFVADLRKALAQPPPRRMLWKSRFAYVSLALAVVMLVALGATWFFTPAAVETPSSPYATSYTRSGVPLPQRIIWRQGFRLNGESAPVVLDNTLVLDTLDGMLVALNAETGAIRWQLQNVSGQRSTIFGAPGVGSGIAFVGSTDEEVVGLSINSGGLIWRSSVRGHVQRAPLLYHDRLIVTTSKGYVYVLRAGNGQIIWGRPLADHLGEPEVGNDQIVVAAENTLTALDLQSGTANWEFEAQSAITTRPTFFGQLVLVGTERGVLHALRASDGTEMWRSQFSGALSAAPAVSEDTIYVVDRAGGITALSSNAQQVYWHFNAGAAINATPLLVEGKLFVGASNGSFYTIDANDGRTLARIQLGGSIETTPALGNGIIYVRADQIYALGS